MGTAPHGSERGLLVGSLLQASRSQRCPGEDPVGSRSDRHWEPEVAGHCARTSGFCKDQDPAGW